MTNKRRTWWLNLVDQLRPKGPTPLGLAAQFRRNLLLYASGWLMLAVQQALMAKRDFLVKAAVDALADGADALATRSALLMLVVSVGAMVARLASRPDW